MSPTLTGAINAKSEAAAVTTRPPACREALIPAARSMRDIIQPPNTSPDGLVFAGIARVRSSSLPRGSCIIFAPTLLDGGGSRAAVATRHRGATVPPARGGGESGAPVAALAGRPA